MINLLLLVLHNGALNRTQNSEPECINRSNPSGQNGDHNKAIHLPLSRIWSHVMNPVQFSDERIWAAVLIFIPEFVISPIIYVNRLEISPIHFVISPIQVELVISQIELEIFLIQFVISQIELRISPKELVLSQIQFVIS